MAECTWSSRVPLSRELNLRLNWILNELVPPYIRDRRWFGTLVTWLLYRRQYRHFLDFHSGVYDKSEEQIAETYRSVAGARLDRPTDLNAACTTRILQDALGPHLLDAGCGSGHLAQLLARTHRVTAVDVALAPDLRDIPGIEWHQVPLHCLPFPDRAFDTVISTHTLEHMRNLPAALAELRRVTARRLLIVVPKERPHRYTPNLHLHFFPYDFSLLLAFDPKTHPRVARHAYENLDGDWYYREEFDAAPDTHDSIFLDAPPSIRH